MKKYLLGLISIILCFLINISIVLAASATITYTKNGLAKTSTITYPEGKEYPVIQLGNQSFVFPDGKGIYNGWIYAIGSVSHDVEADYITEGNISDTYGSDITVTLDGQIEKAMLTMDSRDEAMDYNVTFNLTEGSSVKELYVQTAVHSGSKYNLHIHASKSQIGYLDVKNQNSTSGTTVTLNGGTIKASLLTESGGIVLSGPVVFQINSGIVDYRNAGNPNLSTQSDAIIILGDSSKTLTYDDPRLILDDIDIANKSSFKFANGYIYTTGDQQISNVSVLPVGKTIVSENVGEDGKAYYLQGSTGKLALDPDAVLVEEDPDEEDPITTVTDKLPESLAKKIKKKVGDFFDLIKGDDDEHYFNYSITYDDEQIVVSYLYNKPAESDDQVSYYINDDVVFTYKNGILSYVNNTTKEDLDQLDDNEKYNEWMNNFLKIYIFENVLDAFIEEKGYDSDAIYAWLSDENNSFTLAANGLEESNFNYVFLEDEESKLSADVVTSFKIDVKNGFKGFEKYIKTEEEKKEAAKADDKTGEIKPEYTGAALSIFTIAGLTGGSIVLRKRNVLNRL